ncbi:MAG TPA: SRPBCC family protein [Solirubrobacterales bacterium]|jgi:uncharacterized protein YndB with AHSA1/START domain
MGPISVTRSIDAPREHVFEFICDLANRPSFTDHFISEFRLERLESRGVGASARMRIPKRHLWMETVIVEASSPHRILEQGRGGRWDRIPVSTGWELVDAPGGRGCEVRLTFWTQTSHPVDKLREGPLAGRFYRRQWSIALSELKDLIESGQAPERATVAGGDRLPVT